MARAANRNRWLDYSEGQKKRRRLYVAVAARTASVCWINHTQLQLYAVYLTELRSSEPYTLPEDTSLQMWPARPGQTSSGAELVP